MIKMSHVHLITAVWLICGLFNEGEAYSQGAPMATCMTMFPKHGIDMTWQKSGPCPFQIKLSKNTYRTNENITLTIEADDGTPLRGIQISAHRKLVNTEEFVGTFVSYPEDKLQVFSCQGGRHNQITHRNNNTVDRVVLVWMSPDNVGDIVFRATFVEKFDTFWATERKELYTSDPSSVVTPEVVQETPSTDMEDIDVSGCGSKKGCFFYPRYCSGADCDVILTYTLHDSLYMFEMSARSPGYVTMGISKDKQMGNDHTITCTSEDNAVTIQNGYNPFYYNSRVLSRNLTNMSVKKTESHVMCKFTRPSELGVITVTPATDPPEVNTVNYDLKEMWYLMMSWGHVPSGTDVMGKHVELPVISDSMIDFSIHAVHRGSTLSRKFQAHGALMVVAWILLSGIVTMIARYFKDICPGSTLMGAKIWFQTHRGLAFVVVLLTAISFAIIFTTTRDNDEYGDLETNHGKIGVAIGVALLVQIIAGLIRPGPDSDIRPWFNWGHRLFGFATQLLAAVNIYLAFNMKYTPYSMSRFGGITVLVWIGVELVWFLIMQCWAHRRQTVQGTGFISDPKGMSMQEEKMSTSTRKDYIILLLYILTLVVFSVVVLCGIFLF